MTKSKSRKNKSTYSIKVELNLGKHLRRLAFDREMTISELLVELLKFKNQK